jgi:hypothetical protein
MVLKTGAKRTAQISFTPVSKALLDNSQFKLDDLFLVLID